MKKFGKNLRKKTIIGIVIIAGVLGIFSYVLYMGGVGDDTILDNSLKSLLKGIEERDGDKIKGLFSKNVLEEVGNARFDIGIKYLYSVFDGNVVSVERISSRKETKSGDGNKERTYGVSYRVKTTSDTYNVYFDFCTNSGVTPNDTGMEKLSVRKASDNLQIGMRDDFVGIYAPRQIDEVDRAIPHEYKTDYGSFTLPAGYYKDDSISTDDTLYFSIDTVDLGESLYQYFSISFQKSDFGLDDTAAFRDKMLTKIEDPSYLKAYSYGKPAVDEAQIRKTEQGYPLQEYSITISQTPLEKQYYIIGDHKYVLVKYINNTGIVGRDLFEDEKAMIAAVESMIDSFVWAE